MVPEKKLNILEKFIIFSETNTKIVKVYSNLFCFTNNLYLSIFNFRFSVMELLV